MTVKAIDWTQGDVGHVSVALRGGSCRIDWGDGRTSSIRSRTNDESMICADHVYPRGCMKSSDIFEIIIISDNDNLIGFYSGCIDMEILKLDLKGCPELEKLILSGCVRDVTFRNNPNLKELDITGDAGVNMNFSNNKNLEILKLHSCDMRKLDISKCDKLWYLDCGYSRLQEIAVSNNSALTELIFWFECPLSQRSLYFIKRALERNNGELTVIEI